MQVSWDDPSGKYTLIDPISGERKWAMRSESGVLIPRNSVDIDVIRSEQRKVADQFRVLHMAATEVLNGVHPAARVFCAVDVTTKITYRPPDEPNVLSTFTAERTAHVVALSTNGKQLHPLVESVFPVKPFAALKPEEQNSLVQVTQVTFGRTELPTHIRRTSPEVLDQILYWMSRIEGTIAGYELFVRPKSSDKFRAVGFEAKLDFTTPRPN